MPKYLGDVRCWVNSGKHLLSLSFSGFDPTRTLALRRKAGRAILSFAIVVGDATSTASTSPSRHRYSNRPPADQARTGNGGRRRTLRRRGRRWRYCDTASAHSRPPRVCHKPKLPGLPHCFGTGRTMRQLPRSFEGFVSLRVQIRSIGLFGFHITSET